MGASESKDGYANAYFSEEEIQKLQGIFANISSHQHFVDKNLFQVYCQHAFVGDTTETMFKWMVSSNSNKKSQTVCFEEFVKCVGRILRGSLTDKSQFIIYLASNGEQSTNSQQLLKCVENILKSFFKTVSKTAEYNSWKLDTTDDAINRLAVYILDDLFYSGPQKEKGMTKPILPPDTEYTQSDIEDWLSKSSLFLLTLDQLFTYCFNIYTEEELKSKHFNPKFPLVQNINWSKFTSILDFPTLLYINSTLPLGLQSEWRLLYSNCIYGDSFVQLVQRILTKGPTIVFVKDKSGRVFGGFAGESWKKNSSFFGDDKCYLFQLKPFLSSFTPTGYNDHYLYFNQHVQTLPNGLGFGGQFDYFGLWIDSSFSAGHSKVGPKCTTYGSPQLSSTDEFEVDTIEVWAVGPEPKIDDEDNEGATKEELASRKSILDKDPGAKAMLSLIGKAPHSEGLREGDETADSPEEHIRGTNKIISLF